MVSLITVIFVLVVCFFVQGSWPMIAGLIAVIPVKIIGTSLMAFETGGMIHTQEALKGMIIGQAFWLVIIIGVYLWIDR